MLPLKMLLNDFLPRGVVVGVGLLPYVAYTGMCRWTGYIILQIIKMQISKGFLFSIIPPPQLSL